MLIKHLSVSAHNQICESRNSFCHRPICQPAVTYSRAICSSLQVIPQILGHKDVLMQTSAKPPQEHWPVRFDTHLWPEFSQREIFKYKLIILFVKIAHPHWKGFYQCCIMRAQIQELGFESSICHIPLWEPGDLKKSILSWPHWAPGTRGGGEKWVFRAHLPLWVAFWMRVYTAGAYSEVWPRIHCLHTGWKSQTTAWPELSVVYVYTLSHDNPAASKTAGTS